VIKIIVERKYQLLVFGIFMILVFLQHSFVGMYFDDYGIASLSYGYNNPKIVGTNYSFSDIQAFIGWLYRNWTGRVLYYFIDVIALKLGISFLMTLQSLIIMGIVFLIYMISKIVTEKRHFIIVIIVLIGLYTNITIAILRHGVLWASAAVGYVWPVLPLLISIYLGIQLSEKKAIGESIKWYQYCIFALCIFMASFSHEQIGIVAVLYSIAYILSNWRFKQKLLLSIISGVSSILGFAILIFAPGNYIRLADVSASGHFAELSFIEKIRHNLPNILKLLTNRNMRVYNIAFLLITLFLFWKIKKIHKVKNVLLFYSLTVVIALASQIVMAVSPSLQERMLIIYILLLFIDISIVINAIWDSCIIFEKMVVGIFISLLLFAGIYNYSVVVIGYYKNFAINIENDHILRKAAIDKTNTSIVLLKLEDDIYASAMPYQKETSFMQTWIKKYYNLPVDTKMIWKSVKKLEVTKVIPSDIIVGEAFQVQKNGMSAIYIIGWNFARGCKISINGTVIKDTYFGNSSLATCYVPEDYYSKAGELRINIINGDEISNTIIVPIVDPEIKRLK